jgi:hypothetical protein
MPEKQSAGLHQNEQGRACASGSRDIEEYERGNQPMKAVTIHQPWATLIALGAKKMETRSWPTKHRGPLAIHAGKKIDREACEREPIRSTLAAHGYTPEKLPTGAIVATCQLVACRQVERPSGASGMVWLSRNDGNGIGWGGKLPNEYYFGDYSDGRYAWELTDINQLPEPIPAKGQQGLWNWVDGERL